MFHSSISLSLYTATSEHTSVSFHVVEVFMDFPIRMPLPTAMALELDKQFLIVILELLFGASIIIKLYPIYPSIHHLRPTKFTISYQAVLKCPEPVTKLSIGEHLCLNICNRLVINNPQERNFRPLPKSQCPKICERLAFNADKNQDVRPWLLK